MKNKIFESLVEKPKSTKKWLFLPLSLLFHTLLVAAIVVVPLMSDSIDQPPLRVVTIMLASAAPPPPPPPPPAAKAGKKRPERNKPEREVEKPKPIDTGRFVAPVDIPDEIPEEDIDSMGIDGAEGVDGGVDGGVPGGLINGVIGVPLLGKGDADSFKPMRISNVTPPRLIKKVKPIYPTVALRAHISGNVIIEAVTDIYGRVQHVRIISGHPLLRQSAETAVRQWIYEPYIFNGVPKPVVFTVVVNFGLTRQ